MDEDPSASTSAGRPEGREPGGGPGRKRASPDGGGGEMPGELSSFLVEFGRLVQKHQFYPPDHPALSQTGLRAAEAAGEALAEMGGVPELRITVLRRSLEVEGAGTTSPDNRVCRTLAGSLHRRHAAALRVKRGVSEEEMEVLGRWLAGFDASGGGDDSEDDGGRRGERRSGDQGGAGHASAGDGAAEDDADREATDREDVPDPPRLEHLVVELLPYDALRLRRREIDPLDPGAGAEQIWRELAAVAHGRGEARELEASELEAESVGTALARRIREPGVAETVREMTGRVLRRSEPAPGGEGQGKTEYAERLDSVLEELDEGQIGDLLSGDRATEEDVRALILEAAPHLSPESLERLVRAADDHEYLEISDWLLRVLTKLVRHSGSGEPSVRTAAGGQVRRQVRDMVVQYHGDSPHTASYAAALRRMSRPDAVPGEPDLALAPPSAGRLLSLGVEVDSEAAPVLEAWEKRREARPLRDLVLWLAGAPEGSLSRRLRADLLEAEPPPLRSLLEEQPPALTAAEEVIRWEGEAAIPRLLELLAEAERRRVRRFVFDQLGALGTAVEEHALERLDDDRWYVRRNLLSLLSRVAEPPFAELPLEEYLEDPHEAVRREAVRLAMLDPGWRDRGLETALEADDRRTLAVGLASATEGGYPGYLTARIGDIAGDDDRSTGVRRRAARALGASDDPEARDVLLGLARRRDWPFFWRHRLRAKSGVVLEAVSALADRWSGDPEAARLLEEARSADDPELRDAAGGREGGTA